jgi:hypothetical protein
VDSNNCPSKEKTIVALFAWLISHQPTVLFSQNKPATISSTFLSEQISTSHQPPAKRTGRVRPTGEACELGSIKHWLRLVSGPNVTFLFLHPFVPQKWYDFFERFAK